MEQLILFRGIQGLGAGSLFPISLAVIGDLFTPAERGKYQGLFGAVFGLSSIVGPLLGGWLTESVSWHWIFFVNLPLGAVALFVIWRLMPTVKRSDATRNLDYLGAAVFTVAVATFMIGLTNSQTDDWGTFQVGGLTAIGLALGAVFLAIETRAKEPIVPLDLWRNRTYAASIASTFFISFGFFGAAIFLPQWFQFVQGISPTESGLQSLALLAGIIIGSIGAGQIVARTGKYKLLMLGSIAVMGVGLWLMSNIRADTGLPVLWVWMFLTGLGIGPTLSVFTIVVQNAVSFDKLGVATSNLTFFRQIGGTIGLAILGTVFGSRLTEEIPGQLTAAGVPQPMVDAFAQGGGQGTDLVVVGGDLGATILAQVPEAFRPMIEPFISNIVTALHQAFSVSIGWIFLIGAGTTVVALALAAVMNELPLRNTIGPEPARAASDEDSERHARPVIREAPAAD
jgi:EmrB/QacA subfamily drug resistance transporter